MRAIAFWYQTESTKTFAQEDRALDCVGWASIPVLGPSKAGRPSWPVSMSNMVTVFTRSGVPSRSITSALPGSSRTSNRSQPHWLRFPASAARLRLPRSGTSGAGTRTIFALLDHAHREKGQKLLRVEWFGQGEPTLDGIIHGGFQQIQQAWFVRVVGPRTVMALGSRQGLS